MDTNFQAYGQSHFKIELHGFHGWIAWTFIIVSLERILESTLRSIYFVMLSFYWIFGDSSIYLSDIYELPDAFIDMFDLFRRWCWLFFRIPFPFSGFFYCFPGLTASIQFSESNGFNLYWTTSSLRSFTVSELAVFWPAYFPLYLHITFIWVGWMWIFRFSRVLLLSLKSNLN